MLSHDDFEWAYAEMSEGQMQHMANRIYKYNGIYAQALTKMLRAPVLEKPAEKLYQVGARFEDQNNREYILALTGDLAGQLGLVNVQTGYPYTSPLRCKQAGYATKSELQSMGPTSGLWRRREGEDESDPLYDWVY